MEELNSLSLMDLKELAKLKGVPGYSKLKKAELIEAILEITNTKTPVVQESIPEQEVKEKNTEYKLESKDDDYTITGYAIQKDGLTETTPSDVWTAGGWQA